MRWLAIFIAVNLVLCAATLGALWAFTDLFAGHSVMSIHGWIAMGLGVVFTSGLGVGLMALVFYSDRSHADERQSVTRLPR
jgi:hypothetical protein